MPDRSILGADERFELDLARNKLYLGGPGLTDVECYDNFSQLTGDISGLPRRTFSPILQGSDGILLRDIELDGRRDELYLMVSNSSSTTGSVSVIGSASTQEGAQLPIRKLAGNNTLFSVGTPVLVALDPFPPSQGGLTFNDAALLVVNSLSSLKTFPSSGSRSGVLGDVLPVTTQAVNGNFKNALVVDPTVNLRYVVTLQGIQVFRSNATSSVPERTLLGGASNLFGIALDRTR